MQKILTGKILELRVANTLSLVGNQVQMMGLTTGTQIVESGKPMCVCCGSKIPRKIVSLARTLGTKIDHLATFDHMVCQHKRTIQEPSPQTHKVHQQNQAHGRHAPAKGLQSIKTFAIPDEGIYRILFCLDFQKTR
jgi:hypothetical protein